MPFGIEKARKRKLAKRFHVSLSFIQTLLGRYLDVGSIEPLPHKSGNPPKIKEEHYPILQKLIEENNDATLEELCVKMELQTQIKISRSGMSKTLQKLKLTRKKNFTRSGARHGQS
nr:helix-turn-helix domain-containing protein [Brasilonema octagenarum]